MRDDGFAGGDHLRWRNIAVGGGWLADWELRVFEHLGTETILMMADAALVGDPAKVVKVLAEALSKNC